MNNRTFKNQLHPAGAHLSLVILNKHHGAIIKAIIHQSYPWPQGTERLNFGRSMSVGEVCAMLSPSSYVWFNSPFLVSSTFLCYLQTWPSYIMPSLADLEGQGPCPRPKSMPYCNVCLDSQRLRCFCPIWPPPNSQSRSASACHWNKYSNE